MVSKRRATDDIWILESSEAAPGHGVLPVNAYVIGGGQPVLVDTGLPADAREFLDVLWSLVAPDDLATIFLTHEDADHAGNVQAVLDAAPRSRLVTNYVTLARLLERTTVPLDRVHVLNPGQTVPDTDGRLTALRPPVYDSPGTVGLHDAATGAVFTVDAFGTYLPEVVDDLDEVTESTLLAGLVDFNRLNHPWTALADATRFRAAVDAVADLEPTPLLSSHSRLPGGRTDLLLSALRTLPELAPYVPPDQATFEQLRLEMG